MAVALRSPRRRVPARRPWLLARCRLRRLAVDNFATPGAKRPAAAADTPHSAVGGWRHAFCKVPSRRTPVPMADLVFVGLGMLIGCAIVAGAVHWAR
jgi:hypothetical protein